MTKLKDEEVIVECKPNEWDELQLKIDDHGKRVVITIDIDDIPKIKRELSAGMRKYFQQYGGWDDR